MSESVQIDLQRSVTFEAEDGGNSLSLHALSASLADGSATLMIEVSREVWEELWDRGLFGLSPYCVPENAPDFEDEGAIQIELELDPVAAAQISDAPDPAQAFLLALAKASEAELSLNRTAVWRADAITQTVPVPGDPDATLQIGFRTLR